MAYKPQIWNSGNPKLSLEENKENNAVLVAEKMNNIEQGIKTAHDEIANIESQSELTKDRVETALGFMPVHPVGGVTTKRKETTGLYMLDTPDSSIDIDISASNTIVILIDANNVTINFNNVNTTPNINDTVKIIYSNYRGLDAYINHILIVDGDYYMPKSGENMYRIPSGTGVIEFNFIALEFEGMVEPMVFGTTGGGASGGLSDEMYHELEDILGSVFDNVNAETLNGHTASDFVLTYPHGTNGNVNRPAHSGVVMWVGTVEPNNALDNDIWIGG